MKKFWRSCSCKHDVPEPPRGFMAFSVPAVPTSQIAAPIQFQQARQRDEDRKQAARFSIEEQMALLKDLKEMKDLLNETERSADAQSAGRDRPSVDQRIESLENDVRDLTEAVDRLTRIIAKEQAER